MKSAFMSEVRTKLGKLVVNWISTTTETYLVPTYMILFTEET